jgi:ketosteroid isomerase-like protein
MTTTVEDLNTAAAENWARLYNEDVHRMIDETYAEEFTVIVPGTLEISDRDTFHRFEQQVLDVAPDRRCEILRLVATGDTVVVQASLSGTNPSTGVPWQTFWCAILDFENGKIATDHTYLDPAGWPSVDEEPSAQAVAVGG